MGGDAGGWFVEEGHLLSVEVSMFVSMTVDVMACVMVSLMVNVMVNVFVNVSVFLNVMLNVTKNLIMIVMKIRNVAIVGKVINVINYALEAQEASASTGGQMSWIQMHPLYTIKID
jgi:hypothetical protein